MFLNWIADNLVPLISFISIAVHFSWVEMPPDYVMEDLFNSAYLLDNYLPQYLRLDYYLPDYFDDCVEYPAIGCNLYLSIFNACPATELLLGLSLESLEKPDWAAIGYYDRGYDTDED